MRRPLLHGIVAGAAGAVLSGVPSTALAVVRGTSPLEAARAAGVLLGRASLLRGIVAHGAISVAWGVLLAATVPRRHTVAFGAAAGVAIYVLDMEVVGRRWPAIRTLPPGPQLADHIAFGAVAGATLREWGPCCG